MAKERTKIDKKWLDKYCTFHLELLQEDMLALRRDAGIGPIDKTDMAQLLGRRKQLQDILFCTTDKD
jgi:hypothetical protein